MTSKEILIIKMVASTSNNKHKFIMRDINMKYEKVNSQKNIFDVNLIARFFLFWKTYKELLNPLLLMLLQILKFEREKKNHNFVIFFLFSTF